MYLITLISNNVSLIVGYADNNVLKICEKIIKYLNPKEEIYKLFLELFEEYEDMFFKINEVSTIYLYSDTFYNIPDCYSYLDCTSKYCKEYSCGEGCGYICENYNNDLNYKNFDWHIILSKSKIWVIEYKNFNLVDIIQNPSCDILLTMNEIKALL